MIEKCLQNIYQNDNSQRNKKMLTIELFILGYLVE